MQRAIDIIELIGSHDLGFRGRLGVSRIVRAFCTILLARTDMAWAASLVGDRRRPIPHWRWPPSADLG